MRKKQQQMQQNAYMYELGEERQRKQREANEKFKLRMS